MGTPDPLLADVRQLVADLGFELVDLRTAGPPQRSVIRVRIDRPDSRPGHGVTASDCARTSRALERHFEGHGLVGQRYLLEVSSPGIERPVRFPEHWARFAGRMVRVRSPELAGHPRVEIVGLDDPDHVRVRLADGTEAALTLARIKEALLEPVATP